MGLKNLIFGCVLLLAWGIAYPAFAQKPWSPGPIDRVALERIFKEAYDRFGVPIDLLKAIGWVESRGHQDQTEEKHGHDTQTASYGFMGLNDDPRTNETLQEAAALLKIPTHQLKIDARSNILGAAVVLRHRAIQYLGLDERQVAIAGTAANRRWNQWRLGVLNWAPIVQTYSGYKRDGSDAEKGDVLAPWKLYVYEVFHMLQQGHHPSATDPYDQLEIRSLPALKLPDDWVVHRQVAQLDPLKMVKAPAADWDFTRNSSFNPKFIVIHDTEGKFAGALNVLRFGDRDGKRSSHYLIRSSDGLVAEIVSPERGIAWHAKNWNGYAIGIEHESANMEQRGWYTSAMYLSSARLVRSLARKYNIPLDPDHIFGHNFWRMTEYTKSTLKKTLVKRGLSQKQTHSDPGPLWRWDLYFDFLKGDDHAFDRLNTPTKSVFHLGRS